MWETFFSNTIETDDENKKQEAFIRSNDLGFASARGEKIIISFRCI